MECAICRTRRRSAADAHAFRRRCAEAAHCHCRAHGTVATVRGTDIRALAFRRHETPRSSRVALGDDARRTVRVDLHTPHASLLSGACPAHVVRGARRPQSHPPGRGEGLPERRCQTKLFGLRSLNNCELRVHIRQHSGSAARTTVRDLHARDSNGKNIAHPLHAGRSARELWALDVERTASEVSNDSDHQFD